MSVPILIPQKSAKSAININLKNSECMFICVPFPSTFLKDSLSAIVQGIGIHLGAGICFIYCFTHHHTLILYAP